MTPRSPDPVVSALVAGIAPADALAAEHLAQATRWLAGTRDIHRRVKPATPSPHLVVYFLLVDATARTVLLCDHRLAGLWLPTGGHVEPGEHPADTVRREAREELGIDAYSNDGGELRPFFLTVTETVGDPASRHTDVTLWFALRGEQAQRLTPDPHEFAAVRWWSVAELRAADPARFEPHLLRALDVLALDG